MCLNMYTCILVYIRLYVIIDLKISQSHFSVCYLKIKSGLFFNDLTVKSGQSLNSKKEVI